MSEREAGTLWREVALASLGFVTATHLLTWPVAARIGRAIPGGLGDPLLNAWTLAWGSDRIAHGLAGFWNPPAFYPYRGTLAYSENLLGISVLVAPVQWVGGNLVLTYNIAFLLAYVVSAAGMYLLARELTGRRDAAVVAAVFYAFCPYRAAQVTHLQVLTAGWLPLALWALHRFLAAARPAMLALFAGAFLLQALSNTYSLVFSVLPIAAVVCWSALTRQGAPRAFRLLGLGAAGLAAVLVPVALAYGAAWRTLPDSRVEIVRYSADVASYIQVTPRLWHAAWLPGPGPEEGNYFPGVTALVLALASAGWWWSRRGEPDIPSSPMRGAAVPYAVAGFLAAVLSLGPAPRAFGHPVPGAGLAYEALLAVVPGFSVLRVPARFGMVVVLALAVLAAFGSAIVLRRVRSGRARWALALALAAAVAAEGYAGPTPTSDFTLFRDDHERTAYSMLRSLPPTPMLELPVVSLGREDYSLTYQVAALFHGHPIVNGMSRVGTPLQNLLGGSASPFASAGTVSAGIEMLRAMGVETLVVHDRLYRDQALAEETIETVSRDTNQVLWTRRYPEMAMVVLQPWAEPPRDEGVPIAHDRMAFDVSANAGQFGRALDGDLRSRWTSGRPQGGTEWVEVRFSEEVDVARVDLIFSSRSLADYPRDLEIAAIDARGGEAVLFRGSVLTAMGAGLRRDPERVEARLPLPRNATTKLRMRQHGSGGKWYWSIDELTLWQRRP